MADVKPEKLRCDALFASPMPEEAHARTPLHDFPEMAALQRLIDEHDARMTVRHLCDVEAGGRCFPVQALMLGAQGEGAPVVGFFGGVHGAERIGTQVVIAFLQSLLARLRWDRHLQRQLESVRLVFMPIVNPSGMWRGSRGNGSGVDLMRNAPLDSRERVPFLVGGQRISRRLPWYRGSAGAPMEAESAALCRLVREEMHSRAFSIALDCHSGFGLRDRIWFPHAHTREPVAHLPELFALHRLFAAAYPHHDYIFEPQSSQYLTHGDLWDHLYLEAERDGASFLPLTLEMGSWRWVRKNPAQLFMRGGLFNPLTPHRLQRALRRHLVWLEFLMLAAASHVDWLPGREGRSQCLEQALARWYPERR